MASSWQTLDNVFTQVRELSGKDTTVLPDSTLLPLANKWYFSIVRELIGLNEDFYAEISSTDLIAGQREYPLPIDNTDTHDEAYGGGLVKLQRVEVTYDGSNWYVANPLSLQEIAGPTITDEDLNNQFSKSNPRYWFKDRSVWLAPVPLSGDAVDPGNANFRIYWIKRPAELTATSDIPDIPKDFLDILSEGMLYDIFRRFGRTNDARDAMTNFSNGVERMLELEQAPDPEQAYQLIAAKKAYD